VSFVVFLQKKKTYQWSNIGIDDFIPWRGNKKCTFLLNLLGVKSESRKYGTTIHNVSHS